MVLGPSWRLWQDHEEGVGPSEEVGTSAQRGFSLRPSTHAMR